jgi:hypothetical protein
MSIYLKRGKVASILLDDDQKVDDIEEKLLMRATVSLC